MTIEDYHKHHIWCNNATFKKVGDCDMCKSFFKAYPMEGLTPDELIKKHFPGGIVR